MDKRLVAIQKRREEKSRTKYLEKLRELDNADKAHKKINREWAEYKIWRIKETERMFDQIENQHISFKEIQNYNDKIANYKQEEVELKKLRNKKLIERNMAENEKELALKEYKEKQMKHEKFRIIAEKSLATEKQLRIEKENTEEEEVNELFVQSKNKNNR